MSINKQARMPTRQLHWCSTQLYSGTTITIQTAFKSNVERQMQKKKHVHQTTSRTMCLRCAVNVEEGVDKDVSESIELPTAVRVIYAGCRRQKGRKHQWCGQEADVTCATQHVCHVSSKHVAEQSS